MENLTKQSNYRWQFNKLHVPQLQTEYDEKESRFANYYYREQAVL
jgi:hypothetical protein